ncbi:MULTISPECIES: hypothetical protein [unclassified Microbacterium]|uniref:hypothetical protein n=1 Tax=unclassified Microbacterium TaxID=2609290 RepID=UPI001D2BE362|nr:MULTISPECIES: hypothetical protein [unclassified Microbacterium]MBT9606926.1 hypothetical protein [Microbacterium sp.]CAH0317742.1 hypothetical protein SRABI128_04749 [Microbacterium sp. Bi128]
MTPALARALARTEAPSPAPAPSASRGRGWVATAIARLGPLPDTEPERDER